MYVESVTAKAFGPLRDETLKLQPGLNVIVGRNESAKSTWHAAIYAAICGRARRKGPPAKEDREFAEQYRPWNGQTWHVEARLRLDNGRHIEIHHELNLAVDCAAIDLGLGRDVSAEIMHAGTPDASRWLGMNRSVFSATACVRQSEILAVLYSADGLQRQLEAAATHAGTSDPTAAQAIELIEIFKSEHVGRDQANSTKPLRRARTALGQATDDLRNAEGKHTAYMALVTTTADFQAEADRLSSQRKAADVKVQSLHDLLARATAAQQSQNEADHLHDTHENAEAEFEVLQNRLAQAHEIDRKLGGREPAGSQVSEQLVADVAKALAQWNSRSQPVELQGADAEELQQQLDALPPTPSGDLSPDPAVASAATALDSAEVLLRATLDDRPAPLAQPDSSLRAGETVGGSTLRDWASRLDTIDEVNPEDLQAARDRKTAAQQSLTTAQQDAAGAEHDFEKALQSDRPTGGKSQTSPAVLVGAVASVIAGAAAIVLSMTGNLAAGGGLAVVAILAVALAFVARGRAGVSNRETGAATETVADHRQRKESEHKRFLFAQTEFLEAQSALKQLENDARDAAATRADLEARCEANGLPTDAHSLRVIATQVDQHQQDEQAFRRWENRRDRDRETATRAEDALRSALQARGVEASDVRATYMEYVEDCQSRDNQARESARRPSLTQALTARQRDERRAADAIDAAHAAATALDDVVSRAGLQVGDVTVDNAADAVSALEDWQQQHATEALELDARRGMWTDLKTQLNGLTLAELHDVTETKKLRVSELHDEVAEAELQAAELWTELRRKADEVNVELPDDGAEIPATLTALRSTAQADLASVTNLLEEAQGTAHDAHGQQKNAAKDLPSVPEAEERLEACEAELRRVQRLASTLDVVRGHLLDAQETVHRNIAPTLQRTLVEWLPAVTENRYTDATVDPETLEVKVRAGSDWVSARHLSFGTAEQIYLLLRVALVTHIASPETSCPMLLDDVTVQADEVRTQALLDTLARLAAQRQMVLFAQEPLVEQWAREQIGAGQDINLVTLEQVPIV